MRAVILAAGRGSRMKGLTDDRPKCLVKLLGRPLLERQIAALRGGGVREIAIVRGYRGELFEPYGVHLFDNKAWESTNMVASLRCAAPWLASGDCIVSYSDIFYSAAAVARLAASPAPLAMAYDPDWRQLWSRRFADPLSDAETFRLGPSGNVVDIGRRAASYDEIEGQYMGLLKFTPAGWAATTRLLDSLDPPTAGKIDMTSTLRRLIESGSAVTAVAVTGAWGEVDSETDLALYEAMAARGELRLEEGA